MARNWLPTAFLNPDSRMEMAFIHAEAWDKRARAHKLQQLLKWEEEGAVVERWTENCALFREPSRLALGRYMRGRYHSFSLFPGYAAPWICFPSYGCMDMHPQLRLHVYASPATAA